MLLLLFLNTHTHTHTHEYTHRGKLNPHAYKKTMNSGRGGRVMCVLWRVKERWGGEGNYQEGALKYTLCPHPLTIPAKLRGGEAGRA